MAAGNDLVNHLVRAARTFGVVAICVVASADEPSIDGPGLVEEVPRPGLVAPAEPGRSTDIAPIPEVTYFEVMLAEYGPPGYVRRPHDNGPEMPVYIPNRSRFRASRAALPHAANGPHTKLDWGGRVHLDVPIDFDPIGSSAEFVTATIPVPQERGGNVDFSARSSRLELKTQTDSRVGPITGFGQVDFFNESAQGSSGSYRPRLRFLYGDVGHFRFGQDASVFMDYDAYPNIIENEGPAAMVLIRQPLARVTIPIGPHWNVAIAGEQPFSDITFPVNATGATIGNRLQELPDFTAHLRYDGRYGHLQSASVVRRLTYESPSEATTNEVGYGVNLTGDLHPWAMFLGCPPQPDRHPSPLAKSRFVWQFAAGYGVARYFQDQNGLGVDAALDANGNLEALFARAWYVGYEHWWSRRWTSTFVFSENANATTATMTDDTYVGSTYVAANLIWNYSESGWVGAEYLFGERRNRDGRSADAHRIQFAARYVF